MIRINLNSDLGEGAEFDDDILPLVDSANVGAGLHAGSATTTLQTIQLCKALGVEIGAHPGYADREHFGRQKLGLPLNELDALVRFQVGAMVAVAPIKYIKIHGSMSERCQVDAASADVIARIARDYRVGLIGEPEFELLRAAKDHEVPGYREGYADRGYRPGGGLLSRSEPGALLGPREAVDQGLRLALSGNYDTICFHGDSPGALEIAQALRAAFLGNGISTGHLAG